MAQQVSVIMKIIILIMAGQVRNETPKRVKFESGIILSSKVEKDARCLYSGRQLFTCTVEEKIYITKKPSVKFGNLKNCLFANS